MENSYHYKQVQVTFRNDNIAFSDFHESYRLLCIALATTSNLREVFQKVSAFIYNFDYALSNQESKQEYRKQLLDLKLSMDNDNNLKELLDFNTLTTAEQIKYYALYYTYYLKFLDILSRYAEQLSSTFMPNTNIQKKILSFSNNQHFFENFKTYKSQVSDSLSNFKINEFRKAFDQFLTYYYAYSLFITTSTRDKIDKLLTLSLSLLLNEDIILLLKKYDPSYKNCFSFYEWEDFFKVHNSILDNLLVCNSLINESFSQYGILPKINEKVYVDKTLI